MDWNRRSRTGSICCCFSCCICACGVRRFARTNIIILSQDDKLIDNGIASSNPSKIYFIFFIIKLVNSLYIKISKASIKY